MRPLRADLALGGADARLVLLDPGAQHQDLAVERDAPRLEQGALAGDRVHGARLGGGGQAPAGRRSPARGHLGHEAGILRSSAQRWLRSVSVCCAAWGWSRRISGWPRLHPVAVAHQDLAHDAASKCWMVRRVPSTSACRGRSRPRSAA
jgi:hypothetical protein